MRLNTASFLNKVLHMESTTSALLLFLLHFLNNIGELSLYLLTLISFQEVRLKCFSEARKRSRVFRRATSFSRSSIISALRVWTAK